MFFEEFTDPIMPERREPEEEKVRYSDPELARNLRLSNIAAEIAELKAVIAKLQQQR